LKMRFNRVRTRGRRSGKPKRAREWLASSLIDPVTQQPVVGIVFSGGIPYEVYADWILSPDAASGLYDEPTVLRMLIQWSWITTTTSNAPMAAHVEIGIITLKLEGTSSPFATPGELDNVPLPFLDGDSDWLWCKQYTVPVSPNAFHTSFATIPGQGFEDIRTRRKIPNGYGLALIIAYESAGVIAPAALATFSSRILFAN